MTTLEIGFEDHLPEYPSVKHIVGIVSQNLFKELCLWLHLEQHIHAQNFQVN